MADCMAFPETFDEFAEWFGFVDSKEYYTNGSELIPVFRVKQWLENENNRQNVEIERLKERDETAEKIIREQGDTILRLKSEVDGYSEKAKTFENVIKNTFLEKAGFDIDPLAEIKAEAIKEFAERLKPRVDCEYGNKFYRDKCYEEIDNLVKEMVGEG